MAKNIPENNTSDEIDLGQLFQMIGNGFKKIFVACLKVFLYLKRNIVILAGLIIVGVGIGLGLNQIISKKLKTEVIVKPNLESKNYLYDVIDEVQANIKADNLTFFKGIGVAIDNLEGLEIEITKVDSEKSSESDIKYLELLQSFEKTDAISDIVRAELQNKSSFNHRITFFYRDSEKGQTFAEGIMQYINTNAYFDEIIKTTRENALNRIEENKTLLQQVNELIINYSKKMAAEETSTVTDKIILDNQERVDITGILEYKNNLIRDIERKKIELSEQKDPVNIINFGKPQQVQKAFFGKSLVLIPLILLSVFFVFSFLKYLNKKAAEIV